jgi:hypothetical protein
LQFIGLLSVCALLHSNMNYYLDDVLAVAMPTKMYPVTVLYNENKSESLRFNSQALLAIGDEAEFTGRTI